MGKIAALAVFLIIPAGLWGAKPFPPPPPAYVYNESVLSPLAEERLSRTLSDFERGTGHQFVVALFQSLEGESLEDYSNRLFRAWKIGGAKANDGLLFCLFKQDRKWRVEVGYGLEGAITDLRAGETARDYGVPHFKTGDFDGGVQAVVEALEAQVQGKDLPAPEESGQSSGVPLIIFLLVAYILLRLLMARLFSPYRMNSGGWSSGGWGGGWGGGGGFSGGGGSSGGGGASGGW